MKAGSRISGASAPLNPQAVRIQKQVSTNYWAYNSMSKATILRLTPANVRNEGTDKEGALMTLLKSIHGNMEMDAFKRAGGLLSKKELGL